MYIVLISYLNIIYHISFPDFPTVKIELKGNTTINAGDTIEILAKVDSSPEADEFIWTKKRNEHRYQVDIHRKKYSGSTNDCKSEIKLVIQNASRHDEGQYQLIVKNKVGEGRSQWLSIHIAGNRINLWNYE